MDNIDLLIELTQSYYQRGWTPATSSNFSIRNPDQTVAITRSGQHKGKLSPQNFMKISTTGELIDTGTPSAETQLHLLVYQTFPESTAVLHTHSANATVLSQLEPDHISLSNYEILKAFPGIQTHDISCHLVVYQNSQNIAALANMISKDLQTLQLPGFLIQGHGLYTWGESLEAADRHLEALEFLIECEILRRQIQ